MISIGTYLRSIAAMRRMHENTYAAYASVYVCQMQACVLSKRRTETYLT